VCTVCEKKVIRGTSFKEDFGQTVSDHVNKPRRQNCSMQSMVEHAQGEGADALMDIQERLRANGDLFGSEYFQEAVNEGTLSYAITACCQLVAQTLSMVTSKGGWSSKEISITAPQEVLEYCFRPCHFCGIKAKVL
jgi:hypothetical protein